MAHIDYYFSLLSSFTYLAGDRFADIAARHGATVHYKPYDILAMFDRTGAPRPAQRTEGRKLYRMQELKRFAAKLDKPMKFEPAFWPTNVAPASYAVIAAQEAGGGDLDGLVQCLLKAVWEEDKNIAEDAVITEALKAAGFDPMLSMTGLLKGAEVYARNLEDALLAGVFGSPFYIVTDTDERFWGQDRLDDLEAYLGTL
ncbi:2-hydroxychromene-2-carboxylate isomerase [Celeribacter baekdonensis]|jgi:2-hydroxychromene-2-carboxylate isomerase|uniref:2-hydroxychromene-2-carboxylate isomerase n=1 Tax=Celeribacter baekdonensis TaxID=875171 RepID=A0A2R4M3Z1_9RHOB|nr:2-hydroxychromene-2-carboxylate isomerase [Celeribacter baekdonensis]AVW91920.1 2-hydroxychromene-2-carboxylate isomerase [Celeribacter baekdonensis]